MTPVQVRIPPQLARQFSTQRWEPVDAGTAAEMIDVLDARFPGIAAQLLDSDGRLRGWINIFIDERDIRSLDGMQTKLRPGLKIYIVPAIAGG